VKREDQNSDEKGSIENKAGSWPWPASWFVWSEDANKLDRAVTGLMVVCAVLFVIDLFVHRHAYFGFEGSRGFYPIAGFFSFSIIVLLAGQLRRLIKRPEDYYGIHATSAEDYPEEGLERQQSPEFSSGSTRNDDGSVEHKGSTGESTS